MKFLNLEKGPVGVGCGKLYGMPVADFVVGETTYADMTEIGYITEDGATFSRSADTHDIVTANYGVIATVNGVYTTEFDTGIISLNRDNLTIFSTGSEVEENEDGSYRIYGSESDKPAELALCISCTEVGGGKFDLYMPRATWVPELEWNFTGENPLALNMHYKCNNVTLPNGKAGSYYLDTNLGATAKSGENA